MTNKEKFLQSNVGFHHSDLSLMKQVELQSIARELNLSNDWVLLALSKDSLDNWERWGFSLFRKPEFRANVDNLLSIIDKMDEKKFKQENQKKKGKQAIVNERTFKFIWNGVKAQGGLLTAAEAASRNLSTYWTFGYAVRPECYPEVNMLFASKNIPDEDDWAECVLSAQLVKSVKEGEQDA